MLDSNADLNEPGLEKALADLHSVLIPGENIEAWATQRRGPALWRGPGYHRHPPGSGGI